MSKSIPLPFTISKNELSPGERLELPRNTVKDRARVIVSAKLTRLDGTASVSVGHGYMQSSAGWVTLTENTISAYNYFSYRNPCIEEPVPALHHFTEIKDYITVLFDKDHTKGDRVTVYTGGGEIIYNVEGIAANDGAPFVLCEGITLTDVTLSFHSPAYAAPIWIYGDSYVNHKSADRWPYYLFRDGFDNVLLSAYPGERSERAIEDFELALTRGVTPEYVLWLMGMNNGDPDDGPSPEWLAATERFLKLCSERGITPVLATIPTCPKVNNAHKNAHVRSLGLRYIDLELAVGADKSVNWFDGMLSSDLAHPTALGARALYSRIISDFPEITQ